MALCRMESGFFTHRTSSVARPKGFESCEGSGASGRLRERHCRKQGNATGVGATLLDNLFCQVIRFAETTFAVCSSNALESGRRQSCVCIYRKLTLGCAGLAWKAAEGGKR
jgi:hypothetical protein